ncbi:alpha/beta fold hydrolase [Micromonospora thermarum]|uniref:Alpha/beta hydrolase n=1 Tax=Micromonospora thermarum TaxID=2720024 RepID=A0ABX0Z2B8_9ACTN|nr:alpha/beta hydrolase [Micromonospora thermarum]NJP31947.1 alpha/beta hydrolase [Micromonospora thermarum]
MTVVFVHGVPETCEVWDRLRELIGRDSIALSLPGFGARRPDGFGGSKDDHAEWLARELRRVPGPVDLVGHDWGALLTYRVASALDVPLRSWTIDVASILHKAYVWHDLAQVWQTPHEGESFIAQALRASHTDPYGVAESLRSMGVPEADALLMHDRFDPEMGRSILDLYRSATPNPFADWGAGIAVSAAPRLVLSAPDDPFDDGSLAADVARDLGAKVRVIEGTGHWWMLQDPSQAAAVLTDFWTSLD